MSNRSILLLSKDLFFVPVIRSTVEQQGLELFVTSRAHWQPVGDALAPVGAIVDLGSISLQDLAAIVESLRVITEDGPICAFGSHVHEIRLQRALEAGCSPVITKGQVPREMPRIVATWIAHLQSRGHAS